MHAIIGFLIGFGSFELIQYRRIAFSELFETLPKLAQKKFAFHLDLFRYSKNKNES